MKTQILRLDTHDDIISTRDKMGWGQPSRILIVWPERGRVLTRRLDLVLLLRHSVDLGTQLGLVTRDPEVRSNAADLGLPVFKDLRQAQRSRWRAGHRQSRPTPAEPRTPTPPSKLRERRVELQNSRTPRPSHPLIRAIFFTVSVLAVLTIAAASFPGASIELTPQNRLQEIDLDVHADPGLDRFTLAGAIPARALRVTVEGRDRLPSNGLSRLAHLPASGQIVFTNLTTEKHVIPAGSVIRTPGEPALRFATTRTGTVQAGVGQSVRLPIQALFPGTKGNLPTGALTAVEGPLGLKLTAHNPSPTRGGTEELVPIPTDKDREQVYTQLEADLRQTALNELGTHVGDQDLLFTSTLTLTQILEATYVPPEGEPGDFIELNLRLEYQVLSASSADLETLAATLLDASLPDNYVALEDSLAIEMIKPAALQNGLPHWSVRLQRTARADIYDQQAINLVLGKPVRAAGQRLSSNLPLAKEPTLVLAPEWWPILPLLPFRINVLIHPDSGQFMND